jgi:hypothetical protein
VANAQVEKLKALGLRHGEKAVVGLSAALCLLFLVFAVTKPVIPLTPDQVAASAKAADTNINRTQPRDDILKMLEDQGVKNPGFIAMVEAQENKALSADAYKVAHLWVTPEPGAGLIRDTPVLIAPTELYAYPGRGGALIFALDDNGKRIIEEEKKELDPAVTARRKKKKRRRSAMMGMMGMASSGSTGMPGMMGSGPPPDSPAAKKEFARKQKELARQLAGKAGTEAEKEEAKKDGDDATPQGGKEITKGLRWVAITGVLDHKKMKDNYLAALKNPAIANPNYKQLAVQRQSRDSDGNWSDWEDVDADKNLSIVNNLPEEEEELTPEDVRISTLVDPLPFLKAGYWEKVHVVSLVPKEKREIAKPATSAGGYPGMMGGSSGMAGGKMGGMMAMGSGGMPGMMGGSSGMMGGGAMGGEENTDFPKSEAPKLMIRSLDFTADPDTTYRFRVAIVVFNPNYQREDVSPGTDTKKVELRGPWSEPTDEVTMPADVTAYALDKFPSGEGSKRSDLVQFQITRWNPDDGVTVVRTLEYGPGQIVGETRSAPIPSSEGEKAKSKQIDFNTRQVVLDETGGPHPIAQVGANGAPLDVPVLSLLVRPDGSVILRDETNDRPDPVRKDMADNYTREIKETGTKRESSMGSMYGGMMGMGGSGMPGMGGGGRR